MSFLEAMDRMPAEEALDYFDNPKATYATLKTWWHSLPEGERLVFVEEYKKRDHALELAWSELYMIFGRKLTPSTWIEGRRQRRAEQFGIRKNVRAN